MEEALAGLPALVECLSGASKTGAEILLGDGDARYVYELRISPLHNRRNLLTGRLVVLHNATERKRAEEERVRIQRLRAAGELSAGVSHNLNNLLASIPGPAELLMDETDMERIRRRARMGETLNLEPSTFN